MLAVGRPREVAARDRPTLTISAPEDGRPFLRATLVGLALLTCAAKVWAVLGGPILLSAASDQTAKGAQMIISATMQVDLLGDLLVQRLGAVRPRPAV